LVLAGALGLAVTAIVWFWVLTLNLELPESWLVEPVMALHDFDNLRLADVHEQVRAAVSYTQHVASMLHVSYMQLHLSYQSFQSIILEGVSST
jgi:hypothetical protein